MTAESSEVRPHEVKLAEPFMSDKPKTRWYQFSLWTLIVGTTAVAVVLRAYPITSKMRSLQAEIS